MDDRTYPRLTLRVSQALIDRLDRILPRVAKAGALPGHIKPTRSTVARAALERGLSALEAEYGTRRRKP